MCRNWSSFFLFLFVGAALLVYWPGLSGGFLFDDYPNLESMGDLGGVTNWETFRAFVFSGWSGPTGRPLSLASFLLDDNGWPSYAPWFKKTNLLIHILCGLLLCWASLLLMRNLRVVSESQAQWIALLTCAFWMLHPYMVSTTLYVVQRMAQLAALFSLVGITGYLYARLKLSERPVQAYVLMSLSAGLGTALATLSKENGALLPLLLLVVEFCLPKQGKPAWQWRAVFLWLPAGAVFFLLSRYIDFSSNPWPSRNFNQVERLLTESRVVCEYLLNLFVPRIEDKGLYQDGYVVSRGLFEPLSTFWSVLFLLFLFLGCFFVKRRWPVIALSFLFFFAAHLMESTVVGLELYFEHRNYLAATFLFLPLAYFFVAYDKCFKWLRVVGLGVVVMLASMTWLRSSLWGDERRLEIYWAKSAVDSPRAINSLAAMYMSNGQYGKANDLLEAESRRLPHSSLLTIRLLLQKIYMGVATRHDFVHAGERVKVQQFDAQTVKGVREVVERIVEGGSRDYAVYALLLLNEMEDSPVYSQLPLFVRLMPYLRARIYLCLDEPQQAYNYYSLAISRYQEIDAALAMVAEMGTAGYPQEALVLLEQAARVLEQQESSGLKRSRDSYDGDILYLKKVLSETPRKQNAIVEVQ